MYCKKQQPLSESPKSFLPEEVRAEGQYAHIEPAGPTQDIQPHFLAFSLATESCVFQQKALPQEMATD